MGTLRPLKDSSGHSGTQELCKQARETSCHIKDVPLVPASGSCCAPVQPCRLPSLMSVKVCNTVGYDRPVQGNQTHKPISPGVAAAVLLDCNSVLVTCPLCHSPRTPSVLRSSGEPPVCCLTYAQGQCCKASRVPLKHATCADSTAYRCVSSALCGRHCGRWCHPPSPSRSRRGRELHGNEPGSALGITPTLARAVRATVAGQGG